MGSIILGTSGWSYDEWVGPFYKDKKGMFSQYAEVFPTSEINSTFYSYPRKEVIRGLYRISPKEFIFAAKLPRLITHEKMLNLDKEVRDDVYRFLDVMRLLREKLGPILIQLPPSFKYSEFGVLERFLEALPSNHRWAVEFRHASWMRDETWQMLKEHNVSYTIVDEPLLPPEARLTADFAYFRWHGRGSRPWYDYNYSLEELGDWVPKVKDAMTKVDTVYGYFNNHFKANAVKNAVEMLSMLDQANSEQLSVLDKIKDYWRQPLNRREVKPLESFNLGEASGDGLSIADILLRFTTISRLQRAEEISDSELSWRITSIGGIDARVREYRIEIDPKAKKIRHDCDDWAKGASIKRMCKHVNKLFLGLPKKTAEDMLSKIWEDRDIWSFE
ncbi:DUF72 domain-containing protein [Candidatus Bathyarchaeota archaeon]|nr:DUF72 domain-containing protein [Candidatus Bathyarchaeota archaeon]MBS7630110.1 DUF72 domain-containing protein [Candidatus Bathyarchaeota archaeon]